MKPRTVKSFVRRQGRITPKQRLAFEKYAVEYILPQDAALVLDNHHPIALDIGFGMGDALFRLAQAFIQWNFVGAEVHRPGVAHLVHLLHSANLKNVKIYHHDVLDLLTQVPDNALSAVSILFPDPWPKKRHQKRRLINAEFLQLLLAKLKMDAQILIKTDWEDYAVHIAETFENFGKFSPVSVKDSLELFKNLALTKYQGKAIKEGREIREFVYIKKS